MRHFSYFLFENFDSDEEAQNPSNPRNILGTDTDAVLSFVAEFPAGSCSYSQCEAQFGSELIGKLTACGVLRITGDSLYFDTPIFLREDAEKLALDTYGAARQLADQLETFYSQLEDQCRNIRNGFDAKTNLYHILCGMVFDGAFFDYLESRGSVATTRQHPSGLDYLTVIYEKCPELDAFANGLLCSYNRFCNDKISLQTFGDANGDRFDLYRFSRLLEKGNLPDPFRGVLPYWERLAGGKDALLRQTYELATSGKCSPEAADLLTTFGYMKDRQSCVPVYTQAHRPVIAQITGTVEANLGDAFIEALTRLSAQLAITAARHQVAPGEIANELYHLLFGSVNEALAARNMVAAPQSIPGEGRYLRCIQL